MNRRRRHLLVAAPLAAAPLAAVSTVAGAARAQSTWTPDRPVRLVVPFAPGGSTDIAARLIGQVLSQRLGQPVVVENRPGAGGNIAAEYVARSAPDGHTLLMTTSSISATNVWLYRNLSFHPVRDFTALSQAAFIPNLVVVHPGVPARDIAELIAYAKANPGKLNYGSAGAGTSLHLVTSLFCSRAGIRMEHVSYRGGAPAATDLVSGKIQLIASPMVEVLNYVEARQLRPLAVSTAHRSRRLPDVPTVAETYFKDMQEDKEGVFDAAENLALCLAATAGMVRDLRPDAARMRQAAGAGFSTATDLADWLVRALRMPFRDAHHVTGRLVAKAEAKGCDLKDLSLAEMQEVEPRIAEGVFSVLSVEASVASRTSYGGTAPANVARMAAEWKERLA